MKKRRKKERKKKEKEKRKRREGKQDWLSSIFKITPRFFCEKKSLLLPDMATLSLQRK